MDYWNNMKKFFLSIAVIALFAACQNGQNSETVNSSTSEMEAGSTVNSAEAAVMTFEEDTYDFGTVTSGQKVTYDFKFKNTGKSPLIIASAEASCGCTVPDYPREPVAPGAEGTIKVVFDSANRLGMQNKVVTVTSNAVPATVELHLMGDVKEAK